MGQHGNNVVVKSVCYNHEVVKRGLKQVHKFCGREFGLLGHVMHRFHTNFTFVNFCVDSNVNYCLDSNFKALKDRR